MHGKTDRWCLVLCMLVFFAALSCKEKEIDIDLDGDISKEQIIRMSLGPDCAQCDYHEVHHSKNGESVHAFNVFSLDPEDPMIATVFSHLQEIGNECVDFLHEYANDAYSDNSGGHNFEFHSSELWLLDSNDDGIRKILQLFEPSGDYSVSQSVVYDLCMVELSPSGAPLKLNIYPVESTQGTNITLIGFLKAHDNRTHLLLNFNHQGTSIAYPVLHVFEIKGVHAREIGAFGGFYPHVIPERLRDLNGDGNTEIIFVEDAIWPSGEPHANIIPVYGIAEYRDRKYQVANEKYKKEYEQLNGFSP